MRLAGSWRASALAARSMTGQTVATATSGGARAPLAGELENEIAAHGVADQRHALQAEALGEMAHHRAHVGGAAGVIERRSERLGAAAVAHVHADNVHAGSPGARGDAPHVARIGRAFEAVHEHRREPGGAHRFRLPMAMAEDAAAIGGIDFDGFGDGGQMKRGTREKVANDGLQMAVREPGMRLKRGKPARDLARRLIGRGSGQDSAARDRRRFQTLWVRSGFWE